MPWNASHDLSYFRRSWEILACETANLSATAMVHPPDAKALMMRRWRFGHCLSHSSKSRRKHAVSAGDARLDSTAISRQSPSLRLQGLKLLTATPWHFCVRGFITQRALCRPPTTRKLLTAFTA